jgi:prophage regulatory protein
MDMHASANNQLDVRLLRLPDVLRRVGLSRSMVYQLAADGRFPAPVRLTSRTSAWRSDDVQAWIDSRHPTAPPEVSR